MEGKKGRHIALWIGLGIVAAFLLLNIYWLIFYFVTVRPYLKETGYNETFQSYEVIREDKQYVLSAFPPGYLSFHFNLSVDHIQHGDENGSTDDGIYGNMTIWPRLFREYKYAFGITEYDHGKIVNNLSVDVDGNMQLVFESELSQESKDYYNEHIDVVKDVFSLAKETWPSLPYEVD